MSGSRTRWWLAATTGLVLAMAACSTPPTANEDRPADDGENQEAAVPEGLDAVLADVADLDRDERRARLIELAQDEGGVVSLYTSMGTELTGPITEAFEADTGVKVELYRADTDSVLQRVLQETAADRSGFDVVETNGLQMVGAGRDGALSKYDSPYRADLVEGALFEQWTGTRLLNFHVSWNTDLVDPADVPTSLEDLADPKWAGQIAMEIREIPWYKTLIEWMTQDKGMSEEEADAIFEGMARNSSFVKGHSLMGQVLAAGEYSIATSNYIYVTKALMEEGAPIDYQPIVEPLVVQPNGAGLSFSPPHPAAAVLLLDWLISDGQTVFQDAGLSPARADLGVGGDVETIFVDLLDLIDVIDEWTDRYQELILIGEVVPES